MGKNNNINRNDENRYKREEIYFLSYFLTENIDKNMPEKEKIKAKNRDKNKIKKLLIPLLIFIVENKQFEQQNFHIKKDFSIIIKNKI